MGVFHVSGLGLNPGAVTVPLTYVYKLLLQSITDEKALKFFAKSGEESEKVKGKVEGLIIFSSKEVLSGAEPPRNITDNLFKTQLQKSIPHIILEYLRRLSEEIKNLLMELKKKSKNSRVNEKIDEFLFYFGNNSYGLKYFYGIEVNYKDFDDCFEKVYITLCGLKRKEVWLNMIGGSNQINLSLLLAEAFTLASTRLYYVFEEKIQYLHPSDLNLYDFREKHISVPPPGWYEFPPLFFDISELFRYIKSKLNQTGGYVTIDEMEKEKPLIKDLKTKLFKADFLRIVNGGKRIITGEMFDKFNKLKEKAEEEIINNDIESNFAKWKQWAQNKGILHVWIDDGKICEN